MADNLDDLLADLPSGTEAALPETLPADAADQVELALYRRAIGGTTWVESLDRNGLPVRLERDQPPDVAAAKAILSAYKPDRYSNAGPQLAVSVRIATFDATGRRVELGGPPPPLGVIEHELERVVGSGTTPSPDNLVSAQVPFPKISGE